MLAFLMMMGAAGALALVAENVKEPDEEANASDSDVEVEGGVDGSKAVGINDTIQGEEVFSGEENDYDQIVQPPTTLQDAKTLIVENLLGEVEEFNLQDHILYETFKSALSEYSSSYEIELGNGNSLKLDYAEVSDDQEGPIRNVFSATLKVAEGTEKWDVRDDDLALRFLDSSEVQIFQDLRISHLELDENREEGVELYVDNSIRVYSEDTDLIPDAGGDRINLIISEFSENHVNNDMRPGDKEPTIVSDSADIIDIDIDPEIEGFMHNITLDAHGSYADTHWNTTYEVLYLSDTDEAPDPNEISEHLEISLYGEYAYEASSSDLDGQVVAIIPIFSSETHYDEDQNVIHSSQYDRVEKLTFSGKEISSYTQASKAT